MRFTPPLNLADPAWLSMRCSLWPETPAAEHLCNMADTLARGHRVLLAQDEAGMAVGFVEASIRNDYVNGTETSPVAFIEGLYVEPAQRRHGVARALIAEIVAWGRTRGCSELASDSPIGNVVAHAFHRALGFAETERVVCFCKSLNSDQGA